MKAGHWIVFDEINAALPEILFTLHSLLDEEQSVMLAEKDGEVIKPKEGFRFFASMNPTEDYAGTKDVNKALLSRFAAVLEIKHLSDGEEHSVLTEIYDIDETDAYRLVKLGLELRQAKKEEKIFYFCSTRDLIQAGIMMKQGVDMRTAVTVSVLNKMSAGELNEVKSKVEDVYFDNTYTGQSFSKLIEDNDALSKLLDEAVRNLDVEKKVNKRLDDKLNSIFEAAKQIQKDGEKPKAESVTVTVKKKVVKKKPVVKVKEEEKYPF